MIPSNAPIDCMFAEVKWKALEPPDKTDGDLPFATHEGHLDLGPFKVRVYKLSDGQRIVHAEDVERAFREGKARM